MRNRLMTCLLAALLLLAPAVRAEDAPADHAPSAVAFEELPALAEAGSPGYRKDLRELNRLRASLADLNDQRNALMPNWVMHSQAIMSLQSSMAASRETIAALESRLPDELRGYTLAAQKLYVNHFILTLDWEIAERARDAANRDLAAGARKAEAGYLSPTALDALTRTAQAREEAALAARRKVDDNRAALADALGLAEPVSPAALPGFDLGEIPARDFEADKLACLAYSLELADRAQAVQDAKTAYQDSKTNLNAHLHAAAIEDLAAAELSVGRAFSERYAALTEAYETYAADTALADAEAALHRAESRFAAGLISVTALTAAQTARQDAAARQTQQALRLWTQYLDYLRSLPPYSSLPA